MIKIVKNTTGSTYTITDTGIAIPASSQYTIPPQDFLLWAASSDVITGIGSGDLVINDGANDLNINQGTDWILGNFPRSIEIEQGGNIAEVIATTPTGSEKGLVVRPVGGTFSLVPGNVGQVKSAFGTALAVAISGNASILTYTVPVGKTAYLLRVEVSGTNIATYDILINSLQFARTRTYFSGDFSAAIQLGQSFESAYKLQAGDIIDIQVTNFRPTVGDFEARLQYIEV